MTRRRLGRASGAAPIVFQGASYRLPESAAPSGRSHGKGDSSVVVGAMTLVASLLVFVGLLDGGACVRDLLRIVASLPLFYALRPAMVWATPSS